MFKLKSLAKTVESSLKSKSRTVTAKVNTKAVRKFDPKDPYWQGTSFLRAYQLLEKNGFRIKKMDLNMGSIETNYNGMPLTFDVGDENIYLNLDRIYAKEGWDEFFDALVKFLKVVQNYGGKY